MTPQEQELPPWIYPPDNSDPLFRSPARVALAANGEATIDTFTTGPRSLRVYSLLVSTDQTGLNGDVKVVVDGLNLSDWPCMSDFSSLATPIFAVVPPFTKITIRAFELGGITPNVKSELAGWYFD